MDGPQNCDHSRRPVGNQFRPVLGIRRTKRQQAEHQGRAAVGFEGPAVVDAGGSPAPVEGRTIQQDFQGRDLVHDGTGTPDAGNEPKVGRRQAPEDGPCRVAEAQDSEAAKRDFQGRQGTKQGFQEEAQRYETKPKEGRLVARAPLLHFASIEKNNRECPVEFKIESERQEKTNPDTIQQRVSR